MNLLIYGCGGLGREFCDIANRINNTSQKWSNIYFIDDDKKEEIYYNCKVFSFEEIADFDKNEYEFVVGVGNPSTRADLYNKMKEAGFKGAVMIDPKACVSSSAKLYEGCVVSAFGFVSSLSVLCENTLVLPGAVVGHDTVIGKNSFVCCNSTIGGNCKVGERVFFAENVPVREGLNIGNDSIMSLGAVILRDVPENVIMFGNPARAMKKTDDKVFH